MTQTNEGPVDVSRLNRAQRRNFKKRTGLKIMGRNIPYNQDVHKSWELYYKIRDEEIAKDNAKGKEGNKEGEGVR